MLIAADECGRDERNLIEFGSTDSDPKEIETVQMASTGSVWSVVRTRLFWRCLGPYLRTRAPMLLQAAGAW